jgi:hypothetical protein
MLFSDRRVWRIASIFITLVLAACQEDGGGGVDPGY